MAETIQQITIIIPVHNRAGIVGKTLESIRQQSFRPLSVILVDNNSTDNTHELLRQWKAAVEAPDMQVTVTSESIPGATAARNRGLGLATTPYVMFFDSDDIMAPNHVERAMNAFRQHPSADIIGWDCGINTISGKHITRGFYTADLIWNCIMFGSMATQRYAMRTSFARQAGGWDNDMPGWNDIEFGIRLLLQQPVIIKAGDAITVETYRHPQSITGTTFSSTPWKWEKALDTIESNLPSKRTRRYVQLRRAILAGDYAHEGARQEASRLMAKVVDKEKCPFYRTLYRLTYFYNSHGGRGTARLLHLLF